MICIARTFGRAGDRAGRQPGAEGVEGRLAAARRPVTFEVMCMTCE